MPFFVVTLGVAFLGITMLFPEKKRARVESAYGPLIQYAAST